MKRFPTVLTIFLFVFSTLASISQEEKKPFTFNDVLRFKDMRYEIISDNGDWIAYSAFPDRGDGAAFFHDLYDSSNIKIIERGIRPAISSNSKWAAAIVRPKAMELENAKKDKPENGLKIIALNSDRIYEYDEVTKFEFSNDSKWAAIVKKALKEHYKADNLKKKPNGNEFLLKHLNSGTDIRLDYVTEFKFDSTSKYIFYTISDPEGNRDGVYYRDLNEEFAPEYTIENNENTAYGNLSWNPDSLILAYTAGILTDEGEPDSLRVELWNYNNKNVTKVVEPNELKEGWFIPQSNKLEWTEDGARIFFGVKPLWEKDTTNKDDFKYSDSTFYDIDAILSQNDVLVWHWEDDRISTNQITWWKQNKNRSYLSVYHLNNEEFVQLADEDLDYVVATDNPNYTIGYNNKPYLKEITWNGWFFDMYAINLNTGERKLIEDRLMEYAHLSPMGNFVAFYNDSNWYMYDTQSGEKKNITEKTQKVVFYDEKWDVPQDAPSYGFGGWYLKEEGFIIYDQYDLWVFGTDNKNYNNLTFAAGRQYNYRIRINKLDNDKKYWTYGDTIFTEIYYNKERHQALSRTEIGIAGTDILIKEEGKKFNWIAKAKNKDVYIYTRESFDEFPDIWVSYGNNFDSVKKVTEVNPQIEEFKWGYTEPFEFKTKNEDTLKGYIIKPDNFDENKKYPMLVYFYEQFAERTFSFYQPRMNHRPNYQTYLSDGYIIIVPDVKYYTGRPGYDATDAIVAATDHVINQGFVDTNSIVLQGHSWGAYQGAFIITQTDKFAASCVGAPVANMTSAYSGIRLGTGLARQFQYEKYQSRIGGNLWDSLDNYLNNSPVMLADMINTPLLIMHGDIDEAVPWEQGIEMYLALRRLQKPVWLLQYMGEKHHPRKYSNKVDWAYKMKEFFDYYALDKPAPKWMKEGEPWWGND